MSTEPETVHLENVVIDATGPRLLGRFWESALDTETESDEPSTSETRLTGPGGPVLETGRILGLMTTSPWPKRRHLASSPFQPEPEVVVEQYEPGDRVSHDLHGLGSVIAVDAHGVTVDFGARTLRVTSPFAKMEKL